MPRTILVLALSISAPALAQTDGLETRLADAVAAMEAQSYAFYVSVDPRFADLLAPAGDDPAFRENRLCFLKGLEERGGAGMPEAYIEAVETVAAEEIRSLVELGARTPPILASEVVFAVSADCGPMSHTTRQMMTPEFLELMDDPEVLQGLMGQ